MTELYSLIVSEARNPKSSVEGLVTSGGSEGETASSLPSRSWWSQQSLPICDLCITLISASDFAWPLLSVFVSSPST